MKKIFFLTIVCFFFLELLGQSKSPLDYNPEHAKFKAIVQMNYCVSAMTSMIENQSLDVLQKESDRLLNNLTLTEVVGMPEIQRFRNDLINAVSNFEITAEERSLTKRVMSLKRDALKWDALSNAMSSPMVLTQSSNLAQGVFYTLLTAARSAVEYKKSSGELDIEELKAMWTLREEDMKEIRNLRLEAFQNTVKLYEKYSLSETDRLTEETAKEYITYLSEPNNKKKLRVLLDNAGKFYMLPSYYYHVGMTYLDLNQYAKAKPYLDKYLDLYSKAPIFRYDEMSGCVALAKLANEQNLSFQAAEVLINKAIKNLPNNSAAIMQCALVYITKFKMVSKGLNLIRVGIDNPRASDKDLLIMLASKLMTLAKLYPEYDDLLHAVDASSNIDLGTYMIYLVNTGASWGQIQKYLSFEDESYRNFTLIGTHLNNALKIKTNENIVTSLNSARIYIETHSNDEIVIRQLKFKQEGWLSMDDINKVDCFEKNKDKGLMYSFVESVDKKNKLFVLRKDIDVNSLKNDSKFPRSSEFTLNQNDIDDLVDFCNDNPRPKAPRLICSPDKEVSGELRVSSKKLLAKNLSSKEISFLKSRCGIAIAPNVSLKERYNNPIKYVGRVEDAYLPFHSGKMSGDYLRIRFNDGTTLMYKYNDDTKKLDPYLYVNVSDHTPKFTYSKIAISEACNVDNRISQPDDTQTLLLVKDDGTIESVSGLLIDTTPWYVPNSVKQWLKDVVKEENKVMMINIDDLKF